MSLLLRVFGEFILLSVQPVALATSVEKTLIPRLYFRASHSTVLDMLRPLIVAWPSPVQLRIMNGRKMTRVASSSISICW